MSNRKMKVGGLILSAGMVCGFGGGCLPDNFYAELYGDTVREIATTVIDVYVTDTVLDWVAPE